MLVTQVSQFGAFSSGICGGALIAKDAVLTAAHCVVSADPSYTLFSIDLWVNATQTLSDSPYEYQRSADFSIHHSSHNPSLLSKDVAIVFFSKPVSGVPLANINRNSKIPAVGKAVTAIGLGAVKNPPPVFATHLMQVSMNTLAGSKCSQQYGAAAFQNSNHLCAGGTKGTCQGDSGGPVLIKGATSSNDIVVGITSYGGKPCGVKPNAYTRVSKYATWITDNICFYSAYSPFTCN